MQVRPNHNHNPSPNHNPSLNPNYYGAVLTALTNLRSASASTTQPLHEGEKSPLGELPASTVRERLDRIEIGTLYVVLLRWDEIWHWAQATSFPWPVESTPSAVFDRFARVYVRLGMNHRVGYGPNGPDEGLTAGGGLHWLNKTIHNISFIS